MPNQQMRDFLDAESDPLPPCMLCGHAEDRHHYKTCLDCNGLSGVGGQHSYAASNMYDKPGSQYTRVEQAM